MASIPASAEELLESLPQEAIAGREEKVDELSGDYHGLSVLLAHDLTVAGIPCAAGALQLWSSSWGCRLSHDFTTHDGLTSAAHSYLALHYLTGRRATAIFTELVPPVEHLEIQGIICDGYAHFHPDGSLAECPIAVDHEVANLTFRAGTELFFRPSGSIDRAILYETHTLSGRTFLPGMVELDEEGRLTGYSEGWFGE